MSLIRFFSLSGGTPTLVNTTPAVFEGGAKIAHSVPTPLISNQLT